MSVFCDSSALVKLYADEADADAVRSLTNLVVSEMARVEVPAAFWRKQRTGEIGANEARVLTDVFEDDWWSPGDDARFAVIAITEDILEASAHRVAVHGLRAYDAVQLASASRAQSADPDLTLFASFDRELNSVAAIEGFQLLMA